MNLHRATRVDRRTLALYCGEQLYGYLVVSPTPRFVEPARLPRTPDQGLPDEPTYQELLVQRHLDSLPGYLPLMDVLAELRRAVEESWMKVDAMDNFATNSELFEAEARYSATHSHTSELAA